MMLFMLQVIGYVCKGQFSKGDCDALRGSAFPVFAGNGNAETGEGKDSCHG